MPERDYRVGLSGQGEYQQVGVGGWNGTMSSDESQGNIYAEVETDYELDSGFTEESVSDRSDVRYNSGSQYLLAQVLKQNIFQLPK